MVTTTNSITGTAPVSPMSPHVIASVAVSAPAIKQFRQLGNLTYSPGQTTQTSVASGYKTRSLYLKMSGSFTSATTLEELINGAGLGSLIGGLTVQLPGGTNLFQLSGTRLAYLNFFRDGSPDPFYQTPTAGTAAPYTGKFSGYLALPFALLDQLNTVQTSMPWQHLVTGSVQLIVSWNALPTAITGVSGVTCEIWGDENSGGTLPTNVVTYDTQYFPNFASGANLQFTVAPANNKALRALMFHASNNGNDVPFSLQNFSWSTGNNSTWNQYDADLATYLKLRNAKYSHSALQYGVSMHSYNLGVLTSPYDPWDSNISLGGANAANAIAVKYIDMCMDGYLTEMYQTNGLSNISFGGIPVYFPSTVTSADISVTVVNYLSS